MHPAKDSPIVSYLVDPPGWPDHGLCPRTRPAARKSAQPRAPPRRCGLLRAHAYFTDRVELGERHGGVSRACRSGVPAWRGRCAWCGASWVTAQLPTNQRNPAEHPARRATSRPVDGLPANLATCVARIATGTRTAAAREYVRRGGHGCVKLPRPSGWVLDLRGNGGATSCRCSPRPDRYWRGRVAVLPKRRDAVRCLLLLCWGSAC